MAKYRRLGLNYEAEMRRKKAKKEKKRARRAKEEEDEGCNSIEIQDLQLVFRDILGQIKGRLPY